MPTDSFDTINYEVDGHTATITLNRPDALNALSPHMITELRAAYDEAENDDKVWLLIVTGTGRAFCTGADVKAIPGDGKVIIRAAVPVDVRTVGGATGRHARRSARMAKPVLTAINGLCCGAGLDWVTTVRHRHRVRPGDILRSRMSASDWWPDVNWCGWPGYCPRSVALRMALMGKHERMSAQRAYDLGIDQRNRRARPASRTGA